MDIDYIPRRLMRAREEIVQAHPQEKRKGTWRRESTDQGGLWQRFAGSRNKKRP